MVNMGAVPKVSVPITFDSRVECVGYNPHERWTSLTLMVPFSHRQFCHHLSSGRHFPLVNQFVMISIETDEIWHAGALQSQPQHYVEIHQNHLGQNSQKS